MDHAVVLLPDIRGEHAKTNPPTDWRADLIRDALAAGEDVAASLRIARDYGRYLPLPGQGETAERWHVLSALASANLTAARIFEAHTDALAILAEAGATVPANPATYGVFAAESPDTSVRAGVKDGRAQLNGTKPWCSLGSELDVGLVTAQVDGGRQLFQVDLRSPTVIAEPTVGWVARGLRAVTSTSLTFASTPAQPVGNTDWYLNRPGFNWGGIGVAACWFGGSLALQQRLLQAARSRRDDITALHVGSVDIAVHTAATALAHAAAAIDHGEAEGRAGEMLALRTRSVVVDAAERILRELEHALGPAPLAFEEEHARRVADLGLYLRQHHGERDVAALGRATLPRGRR